jgi:hypothetical protein
MMQQHLRGDSEDAETAMELLNATLQEVGKKSGFSGVSVYGWVTSHLLGTVFD